MIRSREKKKKKEVRFLLIYHAIITLRSLTRYLLHWTWSFTELALAENQASRALKCTLALSYSIMKNKAQPQPVWNEVIIYCQKKKDEKKDIVLWTSWLCAKRCFRSEEGHTASTNINARTSLPLQNKESTALYTSRLIKAVLFLENPTCFSINIC